MKYDKKICLILSTIIERVSDKDEDKKISVSSLVDKILPTFQKSSAISLVEILEVEYLLLGEWGECGLAVFLDGKYQEVIRLAYETTSRNIKSWIIQEKRG